MRFALKGYPMCECVRIRVKGSHTDVGLSRAHTPPGGYWVAWVEDEDVGGIASFPVDLMPRSAAESLLRRLVRVAERGRQAIKGELGDLPRWQKDNGQYVEFMLDGHTFTVARFWGPKYGWGPWAVIGGLDAILPQGAEGEVWVGR